MMTWVVIRYKFNEDTRCWQPDGIMEFKTDAQLLDYLRAQAPVADKYRHEITTTAESARI